MILANKVLNTLVEIKEKPTKLGTDEEGKAIMVGDLVRLTQSGRSQLRRQRKFSENDRVWLDNLYDKALVTGSKTSPNGSTVIVVDFGIEEEGQTAFSVPSYLKKLTGLDEAYQVSQHGFKIGDNVRIKEDYRASILFPEWKEKWVVD